MCSDVVILVGMTPTPFTVGQHVTVWKYGLCYRGTVTKVGRTRVFVKYTTKGGRPKEFPFPMEGLQAPKVER